MSDPIKAPQEVLEELAKFKPMDGFDDLDDGPIVISLIKNRDAHIRWQTKEKMVGEWMIVQSGPLALHIPTNDILMHSDDSEEWWVNTAKEIMSRVKESE